jgi:hypothetical protein
LRSGHTSAPTGISRDELLRRFAALPGTFPNTKRYAAGLTAGVGHDRFDFTIALMIEDLAHRYAGDVVWAIALLFCASCFIVNVSRPD